MEMEWPDDAANPKITFAVDTQGLIGELIERNNTVVDWIKGHTIGVFFSPEAYESLRLSTQQGRVIQSPEYWVHNNIAFLNAALERAGVEDRMRVELFYITEEEHLRYKHDLQWHMDGWWSLWHHKNGHFNLKNYERRISIDWGLLHELMHQLGVIDIYNMHMKPNQVMVPDANRAGIEAGCGKPYWNHDWECFRFSDDIEDLMSDGTDLTLDHIRPVG